MTSMIGSQGSSSKLAGDKIPKGYRAGQLQQFTPEQMNLFQQAFGHVGPDSYLSRLASGDQSQFAEMEAPALRQFNELQGNIASRFSGMGIGARRSSGFQNTQNAAASNFAQDLASRRMELQNQAIRDLMGLSGQLLQQRPYDRFLVEKQQDQGFNWGGLGGGLLGGLGGFMVGGPAGAIQGAGLGYGVGSGISGYGPGGTENLDYSGLVNSATNYFSPQRTNPNLMQMARGTY